MYLLAAAQGAVVNYSIYINIHIYVRGMSIASLCLSVLLYTIICSAVFQCTIDFFCTAQHWLKGSETDCRGAVAVDLHAACLAYAWQS